MNHNLNELIILRKELHKHPELSNSEHKTAERILNFLKKHPADKIITDIGGNGIAVLFKGREKGKDILFRYELDALPIEEVNEFKYKSMLESYVFKYLYDLKEE